MDYDTAQKWIMNHSTDSEEKLAMVINLPVVAKPQGNRQLPGKKKGHRKRYFRYDLHGYSMGIPQGDPPEAG